MNLITVGVTGLRQQLLSHPTIVSMVTAPGGQIKIFRSTAPGDLKTAYILIFHLSGGERNTAPSRDFDMTFRVEGVSPDQIEAETLADAIEKSLVGSWPGFPDNWIAWTAITGQSPFEEVRNVQNIPYYRQGAQYRIRATKRQEN